MTSTDRSVNQSSGPKSGLFATGAPQYLNQMLLVVGMHRSGTSALAGLLTKAGVASAAKLNPAAADNPRGYWEPAEIVALHDELLWKLGSSWDDVAPISETWQQSDLYKIYRQRLTASFKANYSEDAPLVVVKDPRICKFMPLWSDISKSLGREPLYVLPLRNPFEVAGSLKHRNNFDETKSVLLWVSHLVEAEYHTRGAKRVFVTYDDLLRDYSTVLGSIERTLGIALAAGEDNFKREGGEFISVHERHHREDRLSSTLYGPLGAGVNSLLARLFTSPIVDDAALQGLFDVVRRELHEFISLAGVIAKSTVKSQGLSATDVSAAQSDGVESCVDLAPVVEDAWSRNSNRIELCLFNGNADRLEVWRSAFRGKVTVRLADQSSSIVDEVLPGLADVLAQEGPDIVVCADATTYAPRFFDEFLAQAVEYADVTYPDWALIGNDGLEIDGESQSTFCFATDKNPRKSNFLRPGLALSPHMIVCNRRLLHSKQIPLQVLPERWSELALTTLCYQYDLVSLITPHLFTVLPHSIQKRSHLPQHCSDTLQFFKEHTLSSSFFAPWGEVAYERAPNQSGISRETYRTRNPRLRAMEVVRRVTPFISITIGVRTEMKRKATLARLLHSIEVAVQEGARVNVEVLIVSSGDSGALEALRAECQTRFPNLVIRSHKNEINESVSSRASNCVEIFRSSQSDYVWFVDDDDFIEPKSFCEFSLRAVPGQVPFMLFESTTHAEKWHNIEQFAGRRIESSKISSFRVKDWKFFCSFTNPLPICSILFPRELMVRALQKARFSGDFSEDYALLVLGLSQPDADVLIISKSLAGISWRGASGDNVVLLKDRSQWYQGYADFFSEILGSREFVPPVFWELGRDLRALHANTGSKPPSDEWKIPLLRQQVQLYRTELEKAWRGLYAPPAPPVDVKPDVPPESLPGPTIEVVTDPTASSDNIVSKTAVSSGPHKLRQAARKVKGTMLKLCDIGNVGECR